MSEQGSESAENLPCSLSLPERLKLVKRKCGAKNDAEFAELAGVARSSMSLYLNGKQRPKDSTLYNLAKVTGTDVDWLLGTLPSDGAIQTHCDEIRMFQPDIWNAPAHFYSLFAVLRVAREYHEKMNLKPTLGELMEWISPYYIGHMSLPDAKIEFKSPGETGQ